MRQSPKLSLDVWRQRRISQLLVRVSEGHRDLKTKAKAFPGLVEADATEDQVVGAPAEQEADATEDQELGTTEDQEADTTEDQEVGTTEGQEADTT